MATTDAFWPSKDDSIDTLQEKQQLNNNAAWGEIACDIVLPDRESDVTEYQSNSTRCQDLIDEKTNSTSKCSTGGIGGDIEDDIGGDIENDIETEIKEEPVPKGGCVQPNGIIAPSFSDAFLGFMTVGGAAYYCLKILELPLLANPSTALIYVTH